MIKPVQIKGAISSNDAIKDHSINITEVPNINRIAKGNVKADAIII